MQLLEESSPPARVALLSDRWLEPHEWTRRGMSATRLRPIAFDRLLADPPDAIVLDPTCAEPRQITDCWQLHDLVRVPVIVLAEGASTETVLAFLERGAAEVVTETPDPALLSARVAAILRRCHREALHQLPAVVNLDGVEVDLVQRVVRRSWGTLSLSRTEFNLLLAFLRAGGRTCTHHELMTRVWGAECASATHYLRLYIRYLREKIEDDPRRPERILNVWGVGYRLALRSEVTLPAEVEAAPAPAVPAITTAAESAAWTSISSSAPPRQQPARTLPASA
jgi:two-component system, OmpR family, KDP operon response regulator KdpE